MATNLQRFERDLKALVAQGNNLHMSLQLREEKARFLKQALVVLKEQNKVDDFIKGLPDFSVEYEAWYSEALILLKLLLPDRVDVFKSHYKKPKGRKSINFENYVVQDCLQGLQSSNYGEVVVDGSAAIPRYRQQLSILKAARRRFESSLFDIRQLAQAELFDSEIEAAKELFKSKFYRAAGAVTGVVLEKHLIQVMENHRLSFPKKNPGIADLNNFLKEQLVIDVPQWRHISLLADVRNVCSHNKIAEPTADQVEDLINGTSKIIKTIS